MSNVVESTFVMDASQAFAIADQLEARYAALEARAARLGGTSGRSPAAGGTSEAATVQRQKQVAVESVREAAVTEKAKTVAVVTEADRRNSIIIEKQREFARRMQALDPFQNPANQRSIAQTVRDITQRQNAETSVYLKGVQTRIDRESALVNSTRARSSGRTAPTTTGGGGVKGAIAGLAGDTAADYLGPHGGMAIEAVQSALASGFGASLAVIGSVAVAGAGLVLVSKQLRAEAEIRLKNEEALQGSINKQIIGLQSMRAEYAKYKQDRIDVAYYDEKRAGLTQAVTGTEGAPVRQMKSEADARVQQSLTEANRLDAAIATTQKRLDTIKAKEVNDGNLNFLPGQGTKFTEKQKLTALQAETTMLERLTKAREAENTALEKGKGQQASADQDLAKIAANVDANRAARYAAYTASLRDQEEAQKRFNESVKEGERKVLDLSKGFKEVASGLASAAASDNPILTAVLNADKAMTSLRENTKGLSKDLVSQFEDMQRVQNGLSLFSARLSGELESTGLRDLASKFRGTSVKDREAESDSEYKSRIDKEFGRIFSGEGSVSSGTTTAQKVQMLQRRLGVVGDFTQGTGDFKGTQGALDRQIAAIDRIRPADRLQRNAAERALINAGQGIDPDKLTKLTRDRIATAAENQAAEIDRRAERTVVAVEESLRVQESIDNNQKRLLEIVGKGGMGALTTEITLKDQTKNGAAITKTATAPTPADTAAAYAEYQGALGS